MAKGRTARFYAKNPKAAAKRRKQQRAYNKTTNGLKIRTAANKLNRKLGTYGNGDGKDVAHTKNGKTRLMIQSKNRAANGHGKRSRYA